MDTWIYWLPFTLLAVLSFVRASFGPVAVAAAAVFLIVFIGLRHEVGDDWNNYLSWLEVARGADLAAALQFTDPGYALLNWLGANWFGGIYFVNFACAVLAVIPLVIFCKRQANPALALLIAVPYVITVVYMGYTRQSVAVGFGMLAMLAVQQRAIRQYLIFVTIAALFHKAAVCLLVLAPAMFAGRWGRPALVRLGGIIAYGAILALVVLWSQAASLVQGYIVAAGEAAIAAPSEAPPPGGLPSDLLPSGEPAAAIPAPPAAAVTMQQELPSSSAGLYSAGAVVRLAQSVVAAGTFMLIAWRVRLPAPTQWLWAIASAVVCCLFFLAFWRSTLADRTGLFFVPLQLYAFSVLPTIFRRPASHLIQGAIIVCSAAAFWVWLQYGDNAPSWTPYQSVLQRWL